MEKLPFTIYKKKLHFIFVAVVTTLLSTLINVSCNPVDQDDQSDKKFFIEVTKQVDLSFQDLIDAFGSGLNEVEISDEIIPIAEKIYGDHVVTAYVINYRTIDPLGNPAVASGTIYYPKNFNKIKNNEDSFTHR